MSFPLVGNTKIKSVIDNAVRENRIPHAILIEGDIGTGRHTLARYISAAAVCTGEDIPCGECRNCSLQISGSHPDITVTAPEENKKNITVAQIRSLKAEAYIKPHIAKCRVFVIDCADTMNEQSQNALLKVLEEPPGAVIFILIAESKAALLETIISRCVVLTLSNPDSGIALDHILQITDYSAEDIKAALQSTQNNIGKALIKLSGNSDTKAGKAAEEFLNFWLDRNTWGMLETCSQFEKNRIEADLFFKDLKYKTASRLREKINSFDAAALSAFYSELCLLEKNLASNINLGLLFCTLTSKACEILNKR